MTEQTQEQAVTLTLRVVELQNGEKANFGVRNNLLSSFDVETGSITFKVFTGEVITFDVTSIADLKYADQSDLARTALLYAYLNKVKANLAPVKLQEEVETKDAEGNVVSSETVNSLAVAIQKEVDKLLKGEFPVRGAGSDEGLELTLDQKAFAKAVVTHAAFAAAVKVSAEQSKGWDDVEADNTIVAVSALWDSYSVSIRNKIRRNGYFTLEKGTLAIEDVKEESLVD